MFSYSGFIYSKTEVIKLVEIPIITTNCAKIIAGNSKTILKFFSKKVPIGVLKNINNIAPSAIGEIITGRYNNEIIKFFIGKLCLEIIYPIGIAKTVANIEDIVAVIKVSFIENHIREMFINFKESIFIWLKRPKISNIKKITIANKKKYIARLKQKFFI